MYIIIYYYIIHNYNRKIWKIVLQNIKYLA